MSTTLTLRDRVLPMLRFVAEEYAFRTPPGYPDLMDQPDQGILGLALDPSYSIFFLQDTEGWTAELRWRNPRNDARSNASAMRHGGAPATDTRFLPPNVSDLILRNLIAELKSRFNQQPGIIHISDS